MAAHETTSKLPLLQVQDLSVHFRGADGTSSTAVENVSFNVDYGETVALVGESGSGKTISALSVLKLLPYPAAFHGEGSAIWYQQQNLLSLDEVEIRAIRGADISMIFQEPMSSLNPLHTVGKQIGEALRLHRGLSKRAALSRTLELLNLVAIDNPRQRLGAYPHQLSGGQRQRVLIAMALANEPKLLIADEPTTALDVTVQAQVLDLLQQLQQQLGMALLLITHDLGVVDKMAKHVHVMTAGRIVESGAVEKVFSHPEHSYTRHLLSAEPKGTAISNDSPQPPIYVADDIKVWFPIKRGVLRRTVSHVKAVDGVSLTLRAGATLGIVGESGSGKTTLGLALLRLEQSSGRLEFDGQDLNTFSHKALRPLRKDLQIVFQDPFASLSPRMSVADIVAEGLDVHADVSATERDNHVQRALSEVGLDPESRHRYPHEFSGGQRQRIAMARALILEPRLVVLDEPTSALDRSVQAQIVDLLRELQQRRNLAYIFISHDLRVIRALCHDVIVMRQGQVVEHGSAAQVFEAPEHPYTRALLEAAVHLRSSADAAVDE